MNVNALSGDTRDALLAGDPQRSLVDCGHAREVLGWEPVHRWRDALPHHPTNEV